MTRTLLLVIAACVTIVGTLAAVAVVRLAESVGRASAIRIAMVLIAVYGGVLALRPGPWLLSDVALLCGAAGATLLLSRGLASANAVLAFTAVAAAVDLLSSGGGITHIIVESYRTGRSDLLRYLALSVPIRGAVIPIVGFGDVLISAMVVTSLSRLGFRLSAALAAVIGGLLLALLVGIWRGGAPAIPFIALALFLSLRSGLLSRPAVQEAR